MVPSLDKSNEHWKIDSCTHIEMYAKMGMGVRFNVGELVEK